MVWLTNENEITASTTALLNRLIRKVWPTGYVKFLPNAAMVMIPISDSPEATEVPIVTIEHPRAALALEAALDVLEDDPRLEDGSDGKSAHPRSLKSCWALIDSMDSEVQGAMKDVQAQRERITAACAKLDQLLHYGKQPSTPWARDVLGEVLQTLRGG